MIGKPDFLKEFYIGGIYTQTHAGGETSDVWTLAAGYNYKWLTVYMKKDDGSAEPAGYITFSKEF